MPLQFQLQDSVSSGEPVSLVPEMQGDATGTNLLYSDAGAGQISSQLQPEHHSVTEEETELSESRFEWL